MLSNIGWQELLVVGLVALIFFGGRLPEAAKNLARAFVQFRRELHNVKNEAEEAAATPAKPAEKPPQILAETPPESVSEPGGPIRGA